MIVIEKKGHLSDLKIYCAPFLFLRKLSLNPTTLTRLPNLPTEASCSRPIPHYNSTAGVQEIPLQPHKICIMHPKFVDVSLKGTITRYENLSATSDSSCRVPCQQQNCCGHSPQIVPWSPSIFGEFEFPTNIVPIIFENFNLY